MKIGLVDTIILALGVAFFLIGIHQTMYVGIKASYWIFMFSTGFIFWFRYRRATDNITATPPTPAAVESKVKKNRKNKK